MDYDWIHYEWVADVEKTRDIPPRDFDDYKNAAVIILQQRSEIARLQKEVERLTGERRMIVSHATMGATDGSDMTVNGVSCEITKLRNDLYNEGITLAHTAHNDAIEAAEMAIYRNGSPVDFTVIDDIRALKR